MGGAEFRFSLSVSAGDARAPTLSLSAALTGGDGGGDGGVNGVAQHHVRTLVALCGGDARTNGNCYCWQCA